MWDVPTAMGTSQWWTDPLHQVPRHSCTLCVLFCTDRTKGVRTSVEFVPTGHLVEGIGPSDAQGWDGLVVVLGPRLDPSFYL